MALSISVTRTNYMGDQIVKSGTVTFDDSYPTGGEDFDLGALGFVRLDFINFNQGEDGYVFHYDYAANQIEVRESGTASAGLDEQDNATDLSGVVVEFQAFGG